MLEATGLKLVHFVKVTAGGERCVDKMKMQKGMLNISAGFKTLNSMVR